MRFLLLILIILTCCGAALQCTTPYKEPTSTVSQANQATVPPPDTASIPNDVYGNTIRYGRNLILHTAYYIGPSGISGQYTRNRMNCTNCHQEAGTKPYSLNLMLSHEKYPQYRPREDKILTLANRVNNCVMRPHSGIPLPLDSKEMTAILTYLKWLYTQVDKTKNYQGFENLEIALPNRAADPAQGAIVYQQQCQRCHQANGAGVMLPSGITYEYPPLWGSQAYQPGSSMHRIIKQARWLKANMPHLQAQWYAPILTDEQALDVAAFVNDDNIHPRPTPPTLDYPNPATKNIDYGVGPFIDTFSATQHKYGPYPPIIEYWKSKGLKPAY